MPYKLVLENGSNQYGAQMGRAESLPADPAQASPKLHVRRVPFAAGGYDTAGAYWGIPANVYCAETGEDEADRREYVRLFVRAGSSYDARRKVLERIPHARFYMQGRKARA